MNELLEKEKTILEKIADIYIFIMILLFPLIVDKTGFFHILECKWRAYASIAGTYFLLNIFIILYFMIFKKANIFRSNELSIIQWLAIAFLGVNILSCFTSPFFGKYNLFIGVGRGEGLIMMSFYTLSFLFVSLFAKFKRKYISYFTISSIFVSLIAILQYIGFNPFNMFQDGIGTHNVSFMGTIGNVDFVSALYCIFLPISFSAFIFLEDNEKWEKISHSLSVLMGFFIIGIIDVQSGKLAFLMTLIIIFPFILLNNRRLSRFLTLLATILMSYCINVILNPEYHYDLNHLGLYFQFNYIVVLFLIVCSILIYLSYVLKKIDYTCSNNQRIIKMYYLGIFGCGIFALLVLYFGNFKSGILYEIHELLHGNFDDNFGTYRIFLWKRTLTLIPQYLLLGSGPDSFAIRFMAKYTNDIAAIGPLTINDTAANVYLTMAMNIGIIGLFTYLSFLFFQLREGIKRIRYSDFFASFVLLVAIICYLIQDFFNLSLVIVTPIFWLLMALHYKSIFVEK